MPSNPDPQQHAGFLFLSGVTGFLGRALLEEILLRRSFAGILVLAKDRTGEENSALLRVQSILQDIASRHSLTLAAEKDTLLLSAADRPAIPVVVVKGDITQENLGISSMGDFPQVTHVCHAAAVTQLAAAEELYQAVNLQGTLNMLAFARRRLPNLSMFAYVGTAYDLYQGDGAFIPAVHPPEPEKFVNGYTRSKWLARKAVVESGLPHCILLPSIITARSSDGFLPQDVPLGIIYGPLQAMVFLKSVCAPFHSADRLTIDFCTPGDRDATLNIIPVDTVAALLNRILASPHNIPGSIYYLTNPHLLHVGNILDVASHMVGVEGIRLVGSLQGRTALEKLFARLLAPYLPFMSGRDSICDRSSTLRLASDIAIPIPDNTLLLRLFTYMQHERNWGYNQPGAIYKDTNIQQVQQRFSGDIQMLLQKNV